MPINWFTLAFLTNLSIKTLNKETTTIAIYGAKTGITKYNPNDIKAVKTPKIAIPLGV